jgi:hypothetical protein
MTPRRLLVAVSAAVLTIGAPGAVLAQQAAPAGTAQKPAAGKSPAGKPAVSKKVLRLDEMKIEGKVQKPQAVFLMPRANVELTEPQRSESFVGNIAPAAEKGPQ